MLKKLLVVCLSATLFIGTALFPGIAVSANSVGQIYYISSSAGSDINTGLSPDSPWKTFSHLAALPLGPGDKVLLKRGDVWNERLTVFANGAEENYVYIGPYGSLDEPAPAITMQNKRDDICIVAQDLYYNGISAVSFGLNYLHIDNLNLNNSRIGIYFRYLVSTGNKGVKVTNCEFTNMVNDSVMAALESDSNIAGELAMPKGNLDNYTTSYSATGGGGGEYVWPSAITIGGRSAAVSGDSGQEAVKVSDITIDRCVMTNCVDGLNGLFYNIQSPTSQGGAFRGIIQNINMTNCTLTGSVNGIFALDGTDGGWDGTETSQWGNFKNLRMLEGHQTYKFANGMTGAIINNSRDIYIKDCEFSNQTNNGKPDGCGLDFESNTENIKVKDSVFANNKGQAILMMDGGSQGYIHKNIVFDNNLFYNNLQGVSGNGYKYDICIWNSGNQSVNFVNNRFVSRVYTAGTNINLIGKYGPKTDGITETGSSVRRNNTLPQFQTEITDRGLSSSQFTEPIQQKTYTPVQTVSPQGVNVDMWTQSGSFTWNNGQLTGVGVIAWVPAGYTAVPKNMPVKMDIQFEMLVEDSDDHSGLYFGVENAISSYGDNSGCLFYANKWGVFLYSSSRGQLGVVAAANIASYSVGGYNSFRVCQGINGSVECYVNGNLVMIVQNAVLAQNGGGYLGFNTTTGAGYQGYFRNISATF